MESVFRFVLTGREDCTAQPERPNQAGAHNAFCVPGVRDRPAVRLSCRGRHFPRVLLLGFADDPNDHRKLISRSRCDSQGGYVAPSDLAKGSPISDT